MLPAGMDSREKRSEAKKAKARLARDNLKRFSSVLGTARLKTAQVLFDCSQLALQRHVGRRQSAAHLYLSLRSFAVSSSVSAFSGPGFDTPLSSARLEPRSKADMKLLFRQRHRKPGIATHFEVSLHTKLRSETDSTTDSFGVCQVAFCTLHYLSKSHKGKRQLVVSAA